MPGRTAALALLCVATVLPCRAQETGSASAGPEPRAAFDSIVAANTRGLTLEAGDVRGEGARWLAGRAAEARHFMIGERHGTAEIPAVAGALFERLAPLGYEHAALEIGPFAARRVNAVLEQGGFAALEAYVTGYPAAPFAFLDWREEARLAARIAEAGGTIWGLDQEFVSSLPMHLDALAEQAENQRERAAVRRIRSRMHEEWTDGGDYLGNADPAALRDLRGAFEERGDEEALARIDALITSNAIYAPYTRGTGSFYRSGVRRENYMKRVLVEHVRQAERTGGTPRVFYKFGGLHSGRHPGAGPDPRVPLGTFVAEWARTTRGEESFHLLVDCNGGEQQGSGQGPAGTCVSVFRAASGGGPSPFSDHLSGTGATLIDLRALRPRFSDWEFLSERARSVIGAFDAYLAVPDVSPSTPFERPVGR